MKSFLISLLFILVFGKASAQELHHLDADELFTKQENSVQKTEETPQSNSLVITPVDDCFAKLSKEDSADIKINYAKPYQECLHRVRINEDKKNSITMSTSTESKSEDKVKDKKNEENLKNSPQENFNR